MLATEMGAAAANHFAQDNASAALFAALLSGALVGLVFALEFSALAVNVPIVGR